MSSGYRLCVGGRLAQLGRSIGRSLRRFVSAGAYDHVGRWPANVVTDGSADVLDAFAAFGERASGLRKAGVYGVAGSDLVYGSRANRPMPPLAGNTGTAARFFHGAKAGARDRLIHCTACGARVWATDREAHRHGRGDLGHLRSHPTVESQALTTCLCKLACPPGGTVLDPFAGSGSTGQAALAAGFNALLVEWEADYVGDIQFRLGLPRPLPPLAPHVASG